MKKIILNILLLIVVALGVMYLTGYNKVLFTKTVVKAQQNAEREVFEESQSYVEGKRQEALKYMREYNKSSEDDKKALKAIIAQSMANFNEDKHIKSQELKSFIKKMKYE